MRKLAVILVVAVAIVSLGVVMNRSAEPDLGTDDPVARELYLEGNDHFYALQLEQADARLREALEQDPGFAMAAAALALTRARQGHREQAALLAARADSLARSDPRPDRRALVQLRLATYGLGEHAADRDSLLALMMETRPDDPEVLLARMQQLKAQNETAELERLWRRIIERNPNHATAYNELGYLAFHRGEHEEAVRLLRRYAFLAPDLANPHDSLGEVLMHLGRYEEAEQEFRKALSKQPRFLASHFNLARVYLARGELQRGTDLLEKLREMTAGTVFEAEVFELAIGTYYTHELWEPLEATAAEYVVRYQDRPQSIFYRGLSLTHQGRGEAAQALMDSALTAWRAAAEGRDAARVARKVASTEAQLNALLCESRGDLAGAREHWARALDLLGPVTAAHDLRFTREQYASCLLETGEPQPALVVVSEILQENPRQLRSLALAAEASLALDQRDQARQFARGLEQALAAADPDYPLRARLAELQRELAEDRPRS
ncbi:MAG: tetratricopeptide repeat protein [Candidatus Krumholzibacteriia bacterium]